MTKMKLSFWLEFVCKNASEVGHKTLAYMSITRLKVLQSGKADPRHKDHLRAELATKVTELSKLYGMDHNTEELLQVEGV